MTVEQLEKLIAGAVSLVKAGKADDLQPPDAEIDLESTALDAAGRVLRGAEAMRRLIEDADEPWKRQILWVDNRPDNNIYERRTFESFGVEFTLALSTDEALRILDGRKFAAIISDMGRREGRREGLKLLDAVRSKDKSTPFYIYAGPWSQAPEHQREATERGAQGATNAANELIDMVTTSLRLND